MTIPVFGIIESALELGDHAESMVGAGHLGTVSELFVDGEGLAVPVFGIIEPTLVLDEDADLVAGGGDGG